MAGSPCFAGVGIVSDSGAGLCPKADMPWSNRGMNAMIISCFITSLLFKHLNNSVPRAANQYPMNSNTGTVFSDHLSKHADMKLSDSLLLKLRKKYDPSTMVDMKFMGKDISIRTDAEGNPVVLFIGTSLPNGRIKGERYTRTLKTDTRGVVIKDHWDLKGKA